MRARSSISALSARLASLVVVAALATSFAPSRAEAAGVAPGTETPVQRFQAEQRFFRGKGFFQQKKYDEALVELHASLDIVQSPNTRLLIARCLREKGSLIAAYVEFGRAAVAARELAAVDARYTSAAKGAEDDRAALEEKIGFVTVTVQNAADDSKMTIGGEEIRRAAWGDPAPVLPGTTEIVVETPGRPAVKKSVTVASKEKQAITIDAAAGATTATPPTDVTAPAPVVAPKSDRAGLRTYAYVAGGVGAAGLLTFVIAGAMANSTYSDLQSACNNNVCPPSKNDAISSGKTQQTIANVGLVFGILGAAGAATLFVLSMPTKTPTEEPRAGVVVGPGFIGVRGSM